MRAVGVDEINHLAKVRGLEVRKAKPGENHIMKAKGEHSSSRECLTEIKIILNIKCGSMEVLDYPGPVPTDGVLVLES